MFAVNAIFVRSKGQRDLDEKEKLFDKCWPIHQTFLSIVQPTIVLFLGNGDDSAFAYLRKKVAPDEKRYGRVKEYGRNISGRWKNYKKSGYWRSSSKLPLV